ncbi:hypothetical protein M413DRAFT_119968 [Hebeloma cylindrosporum]|uniref:Uncharacterized protein n=1 Tax=Hebeloma cylindrosporum TaxID=76867 RepID=A0A0C3CG24_HEBCY|nr:hypothetical protein M413DRAFT_119968 [Hebeloma cylindrosporum h7]
MMDVSPRPQQLKNDSGSPAPAPVVANSNAQLANMLSEAYRDVDVLRRDLALERKRAEHSDRILAILKVADTPSPSSSTNGASIDIAEVPKNPDMRKVVEEYEKRITEAESARDEAETRRREALDAWRQLDEYLSTLELSARDARAAFCRTRLNDETHGGPFSLSIPPTPYFSPSTSHVAVVSQSMAPPNNLPLRTHSSHSSSRRTSSRAPPMVGLPLPPHPIPNPSGGGLPPSTGARRPRTPSVDNLYAAAQPPTKRSRATLEDQRGREPRSSYSDIVSLRIFKSPFMIGI